MSASIWSPYTPGVISTDQVMYTQGGIGSKARTTTSKLQEQVSVKDFGAVGDGVTDDTAAVQAAIDAAAGGTAVAPSGHAFIVSSTLLLPSNITITGGGTIKLAAGANTHIFQNSNYTSGSNENIVLDGVVIDGNVTNQTNDGSYNKHGIRMQNATGLVIRECEIKNVGTDCINLIDCERPVIKGNYLWGAYNHAVTFQNTNGLLGEGNIIHDCGSKTDATGFTAAGHAFIGVNVACNDVILTGNYVYDMGDSCLRNERAGEGWVISNNLVVRSGKDSIKIMGVVGGSTKPKANVVSNNVVVDAGNHAIVANGDAPCLITGNVILRSGFNTAGAAAGKWFASAGGISVTDNTSNVVIENNVISNTYASGITVQDATSLIIRGNVCEKCGDNGMVLNQVSSMTIEHNVCRNNSQRATNTFAGIYIQDQAGATLNSRTSLRFNRCYDDQGSATQRWGMRLEGGANVTNSLAQFNDLFGNTQAAQLFTNWSGAGNVINQNTGYVTENSGTATVSSGTTLVAVTHGLNITPALNKIQVTPTNNLGAATKFWIGATSSTVFQILTDSDPGATTATFSWSIE